MALLQRSRSLHLQAMRVFHSRPNVAGVTRSETDFSWRLATFSPCRPFSTGANTRLRRRKRPKIGKGKVEGNGPPRQMPEIKGLTVPYSYGGEDGEGSEEYFKKVTLSPWVPIPDPIARKLFDMSAAGPEDIHVELGCGDGRVNFYAIDHGRVKKSIGIDIDDGILKQARERLGKRYPQPPLEFITADLLDYNNHKVWEIIQEATIITMYFVEDALQHLRPMLEEKLAGKQCKIITCAYEMKGWNPHIIETTLGTTVYLYNFGSMDDDDDFFITEDRILRDRPKEWDEDPLEKLQKQGLDLSSVEHFKQNVLLDREVVAWPDDDDDDDKEEEEEETEGGKDMAREAKYVKPPPDIKNARKKKNPTPCSTNK